MNRNALWTLVTASSLSLIGCGGHHSSPAASMPSNSAPTDFTSFVNRQLQQQPGSSVAPEPTGSLTTDLSLGGAAAFSGVNFGKGDSLPAGTNQAAVACAQAGQTACNPSVSDDLNSNLN